jgi:hypothetical protein
MSLPNSVFRLGYFSRKIVALRSFVLPQKLCRLPCTIYEQREDMEEKATLPELTQVPVCAFDAQTPDILEDIKHSDVKTPSRPPSRSGSTSKSSIALTTRQARRWLPVWMSNRNLMGGEQSDGENETKPSRRNGWWKSRRAQWYMTYAIITLVGLNEPATGANVSLRTFPAVRKPR